jgi:hypothetical protein
MKPDARGFLKRVALLGILSLMVLVPLLWFSILSVVVYGGAFIGDLFERFGNPTAAVASYAGLLLTTAAVVATLVTVGGLVLASLVSLGQLVLRQFRSPRL